MNTLRIDTSNSLTTKIELDADGEKYSAEDKRGKPGDQNVLELVEKVLGDHHLTLKDIQNIEVNTGPGSFTGLRVGVAIANALSFAANVSVNGKPLGEIVEPTY